MLHEEASPVTDPYRAVELGCEVAEIRCNVGAKLAVEAGEQIPSFLRQDCLECSGIQPAARRGAELPRRVIAIRQLFTIVKVELKSSFGIVSVYRGAYLCDGFLLGVNAHHLRICFKSVLYAMLCSTHLLLNVTLVRAEELLLDLLLKPFAGSCGLVRRCALRCDVMYDMCTSVLLEEREILSVLSADILHSQCQ